MTARITKERTNYHIQVDAFLIDHVSVLGGNTIRVLTQRRIEISADIEQSRNVRGRSRHSICNNRETQMPRG